MAGTGSDPLTRGRTLALGAVTLGVLLALGIALSSQFGVTWDFQQTAFYGERYVRFFATLDPHELDFRERAIDYPATHPDLEPGANGVVPGVSGPHFVWPLPYTLAALGCWLGSLKLALLDFHAAHHLVNFVLAAVLAIAMVAVGGRSLGVGAAAVGALLLIAHPAFFGHLFNNLRDIPMACWFGLALLCWLAFLERGKWRALIAFALCTGAALACKTPAVLVPVIALAAAVLSGQASGRERARKIAFLLLASVAAFGVFIAFWPWLWADPWHRLAQHIEFIRQQRGLTDEVSARPLLEALGTMPPVTHALGLLGLVVLARDRARRTCFWLLLVWLAVPLVRICLPRARNYGGIRHFIEFLPAFTLFAGAGFVWLQDLIRKRSVALARASLVLLLSAVWPVLAAHPYQTSYCSSLVGGVAGARALGLTAAYDFWGNSLREGIDWLDRHAPPQSSVVVPLGDQIVKLVAGIWLRDDIAVVGSRDQLDASRTGRVYGMVLARGPNDRENRMPWVARLTTGDTAFACELQGEPLLTLHDLGAHGAAAEALAGARAGYRAELAGRIDELKAAAFAHADDIDVVLDYLFSCSELYGVKAAHERLLELLPMITDPVQREKLMRALIETGSNE